MSSVILPPIANRLIEGMGVLAAFKIIGIVFLVVICLCSLVMEKCPEDYALAGYTLALAGGGEDNDKNWRQMLKEPAFYIMITVLVCGAFTGLMLISQASPLAKNMMGFNAAASAAIVSVLALFNSIGRVCAGMVSDKIGRINTIRLALILAVAGILMLIFGGSTSAIFVCAMAFIGVCFGSFMGVFPGFTAEKFGMKYNTVNYGIMFIGFAFAGIIGPVAISRVYALSGSYTPAFIMAACFAAAGLVLTMFIPKE